MFVLGIFLELGTKLLVDSDVRLEVKFEVVQQIMRHVHFCKIETVLHEVDTG